MQQTFRINSGSLNANFIESVRTLFKDRDIKIVVEDIEQTSSMSQSDLYKKTLELRELFKDARFPTGVDESDLANEMLGE